MNMRTKATNGLYSNGENYVKVSTEPKDWRETSQSEVVQGQDRGLHGLDHLVIAEGCQIAPMPEVEE